MDGDWNRDRLGGSRKAEGDEQKKCKRRWKDGKKKERKKRRRIKWLAANHVWARIWETFSNRFLSGSVPVACCCTHWLLQHRLRASIQFRWHDHYVLNISPTPKYFITIKGNLTLIQQKCELNVHYFHQAASYLGTSGCSCQRQSYCTTVSFNRMDDC